MPLDLSRFQATGRETCFHGRHIEPQPPGRPRQLKHRGLTHRCPRTSESDRVVVAVSSFPPLCGTMERVFTVRGSASKNA